MSVLFNDIDLHRWLDERTIRKAAGYLDSVYDLRMERDLLHAKVEGTSPQPYRVTINLKASLRSPDSHLNGRCSCPVGDNCKHVAAVMMCALHGPDEDRKDEKIEAPLPQHAQPVRAELLTRLSEWHAQHAARAGSSKAKQNPKSIAFVLSVFQFRLGIHAYRMRRTADGALEREKRFDITPELVIDPPGYVSQQASPFSGSCGCASSARAADVSPCSRCWT